MTPARHVTYKKSRAHVRDRSTKDSDRHLTDSSAQPATTFVRAAQYLRMSTEHQQFSLQNQQDVIRGYAKEHGLEITKTYSDAAKSGITLTKRGGLRRLLQDVVSGECDYGVILVYDVSRWGRFQDNDEAACYEFLCRKSGIEVQYCAEAFSNDGSISSSILKAVKRAMASEFSRELGIRLFDAKARIVERGFWVGGRAPFGMRRCLVAGDRTRNRVLESGEHKYFSGDRVVLVPGPREEIRCVRSMYDMALRGMGFVAISEKLNSQSLSHNGKRWNSATVKNMLTSPVYAGYNVWNRTCQKLSCPTLHVPSAQWIQKAASFSPLIDERTFAQVQAKLQQRAATRSWPDEKIIAKLRVLLARKGHLSQKLIEKTPGMPSSRTIRHHFGSYRRTYEIIGYRLSRKVIVRSEEAHRSKMLRDQFVGRIQSMFPDRVTVIRGGQPILCLDGRRQIAVEVARSVHTPRGAIRWRLNPTGSRPDVPTLLCRFNAANTDFQNFDFLPPLHLTSFHRIAEGDPWLAKGIRLGNLSEFCELASSLPNWLPSER